MARDLQAEIRAALAHESLGAAVTHGTRSGANSRRRAVAGYVDYDAARDRARAIKEDAIERLPELLEQLERAVRAAGGHVHHAEDAAAACDVIVGLARKYGVRRAVKSKSMTTEEIELNHALEAANVHVRETDLGEYIVQLDGDRPSHLVAPIMHKSLEEVRQAFRKGLGRADVPERAIELTQLAREQLRADFLAADMGITGANFLIAETGTVVLVENEGNARLSTQVPPLHVAVAGIEKVIPSLVALEPFLQLLPRSATGQLMTCYLSMITGPGWAGSPMVRGERQFHLVLLDNGRSRMRDDPVLREALYCVRCGACMNVCAPYQAVGGHVFGGPTYPSGIGVAWEAGIRGLDVAAEFNDLCTSCSRCQDVCPVRIDIPWMSVTVRDRFRAASGASSGPFGGFLAEPRRAYAAARRAGALARIADSRSARRVLQSLSGIDARRPLPEPAPETLSTQFVRRGGHLLESARAREASVAGAVDERVVVFWADCHTDHVEVDAGESAIAVLERLGYRVLLAGGACCGRAALSIGEFGEARRLGRETVSLLERATALRLPIVGLEPSCLTCVADDYRRLLPDGAADAVADAVIDIFSFLAADLEALRAAVRDGAQAGAKSVVLHGHCQQKSAGWFGSASACLQTIPGLRLQTTQAECCGMAGSFGYKHATYEVSRELGNRLIAEIEAFAAIDEVVVCGTSCRAQLADLGGRRPRHAIQLVAEGLGL